MPVNPIYRVMDTCMESSQAVNAVQKELGGLYRSEILRTQALSDTVAGMLIYNAYAMGAFALATFITGSIGNFVPAGQAYDRARNIYPMVSKAFEHSSPVFQTYLQAGQQKASTRLTLATQVTLVSMQQEKQATGQARDAIENALKGAQDANSRTFSSTTKI